MSRGFLVLETGECFAGVWRGGRAKAGEVVFNTSHSGYEEIATDPSYYSQILIATAPMQGNYGVDSEVWESGQIWINGFICLEIQESSRDKSWLARLDDHNIPIVTDINTREIVLGLRENGTTWGALVEADSEEVAQEKAKPLISEAKGGNKDWAYEVSRKQAEVLPGEKADGPRVAVMDFGCKTNILRELQKRCSEVKVFPSRASSQEILEYKPQGVMLSNGPGDPEDVQVAVDTVKGLLGETYIFGICMGHQILCRALNASTYKLKFGHRGSNHPIQDKIFDCVYMSSQNHGYAVDMESLPKHVEVTHMNLNDNTVSGIRSTEGQFFAVQFHPESCPGPNDSRNLFDYFTEQLR